MDHSQISGETLELIKASATAGVNTTTGITGIDLSGVVSLVPVNTPFYDGIAKTKPSQGAKYAQWKALLNINNQQADPGVPFDYAAPLALLQELDVSARFGRVGFGYTVTQDSIDEANGYADAKAIAVFNSLNQYKIGMDRKLLGGQNFALQTPTGVTVVPTNTGGTIPASTSVSVQVAAKTLSNYNYGGSGIASTAVAASTAAGAATNSATAFVPAVQGAVAYDWFVGGFYYTTTVVNTVVITSIPTAARPTPALPGLFLTAPTAVPTVDGSAKPNDFNGLLATLAGDYASAGATGLMTHGTGTPSGAVFESLDGAPFSINGANVAQLDALNAAIYANVQLSPDAYMMSSGTASSLSAALLTTGAGAYTQFSPNVSSEREGTIAGAFVSWYINKSNGGTPVRIDVQPNMADGMVIARTDSVPFPNSNITNVLEQRDLAPIADYEYAAARLPGQAGGGPRYDGETYSSSALINRAPVAMGVLSNITTAV